MTLITDLLEWDGKHTDLLRTVYATHVNQAFIDDLLTLLNQPDLHDGTTWLLKHHLESKSPPSTSSGGVISHLSETQSQRLIIHLPQLNVWTAQLHILQIFDRITVSDAQIEIAETFIRNCLASKKTFVRAWAYSAFHELAKQHPAFRPEVDILLATAMDNEKPSVRARIRNLK